MGLAAAWPLAARAQQQSIPVVGYLASTTRDAAPFQTASFRRGLAEGGFTEGSNVLVEYRWGDDKPENLPVLAADLINIGVNIIAAFGTASILTAKVATGSIPIVFLTGDDPITAGVVSSLSRPSANVTGVTFNSAPLYSKRLELLRGLIRKSDLIALLIDSNSPESVTQSRNVQNVASALGQSVISLNVRTETEIELAFGSLAQQRVDAFIVSGSPFFNGRRDLIAALAVRHAIPGMYPNRNFAAAGGLISYGANIADAYRQAGIYVARLLKGAKPGDLPVLQPNKFDLVINLRTARVLKIAVPDRLLALADDVIE
jgi:putative tryptophan/tyrosine transport system substrate-binding protein